MTDNRMLSGGGAVTPDHREINPATGQQKGYVVLTPEERAKGFVRPVRRTYIHVGLPATKNPVRDLTPEEHQRYDQFGYVKYEDYPPSDSSVTGKFWTQAEIDKIGKGCGSETRMSQDIAETYARDPRFYGATFCCHCRTHLPLAEFVWKDNPDQIVGS